MTALLDGIFKFAITAEWLEFILTEFIFTILMPGSFLCTASFPNMLTVLLLALLHTSLKWLSLPHLSHLFPYTGHYLSLCSCLQYLHHLQVLNVFAVGFLSMCLTSFCTIASKLFVS